MGKQVYDRIVSLAKEQGISIRSLETKLGFCRGKISKLATTPNPSLESVEKIANYFGVTIDYLIGATDIKKSASEILKDKDLAFLQRAKENLPPQEHDRMMRVLHAMYDFTSEDEN